MSVHLISELTRHVLDGVPVAREEALAITRLSEDARDELCHAAVKVREYGLGNTVTTCSITNAKSGLCSEDCAYCAQSIHHAAHVETYGILSVDEMEHRFSVAAQYSYRHSFVTSGRGPSDEEIDVICSAVQRRKAFHPQICASLGIAEQEQLERLKQAGVTRYHHNLESSRSFFDSVTTTHSWEERRAVLDRARKAGLSVCSGGIFGVGESWEQRVELFEQLRDARPDSVPINFLVPIAGTPLGSMPLLSEWDAVKIIALARFFFPSVHIRIAGGRKEVFSDSRVPMEAGASGIMMGDLLTVGGRSPKEDIAMLKELGLQVGPG